MNLDLYVVTDEKLSDGKPHAEIARLAVAGGADAVQLRDKTMSAGELFAAASDVRKITEGKALFLVNDRLDIALACGADGVHLGQSDLPAEAARRIAPEGFIIGVSVWSVHEAQQAEKDGADYIAVSPVFATTSKDDAGEGCGIAAVREIRSAVSCPVIGIGGITADNAAVLIEAGLDGIAVISAVVSADDVEAAAGNLKRIVTEAKHAG
jgi:thiamine-phosphate pyrophosphorylase